MDLLTALVTVVIGIFTGAVVTVLWSRAARVQLQERLLAREEAYGELEQRLGELKTELETAQTAETQLRKEFIETRTRLETSEQSAKEKIALLEDAKQQLSDAFQALSAEALRQNNRSFLDLAEVNFSARERAVDELVRPLKEQLQILEERRSAAYVELREQVRSLAEVQTHLQREAGNLARALRAPNVRGRWGELQLRRALELAGMVAHVDFIEQEQGSMGRPDLVVHLPGERRIVIDSKVPLAAYLESLEVGDDLRRTQLLKEHAQQVKAHLIQLSSKQYWQQFTTSPEFVIAFLPGEVFYSAALEQDPTLFELGVDKGVLLATPTTLIALLKAIAYGWRQEAVARDAQQIAALGSQLHERLLSLTNHFDEMRRSLERSVQCYNSAVGAMEARVLVSARRLKEMGAAGSQAELPFLEQVETSPRLVANR